MVAGERPPQQLCLRPHREAGLRSDRGGGELEVGPQWGEGVKLEVGFPVGVGGRT